MQCPSDYITMSDITKTIMLHVILKSRICIYSVENIFILLCHLVHMAAILDLSVSLSRKLFRAPRLILIRIGHWALKNGASMRLITMSLQFNAKLRTDYFSNIVSSCTHGGHLGFFGVLSRKLFRAPRLTLIRIGHWALKNGAFMRLITMSLQFNAKLRTDYFSNNMWFVWC